MLHLCLFIDFNAFTQANFAPLQVAINSNRIDIAQLLIDSSANPACVDKVKSI